MADKTGKKESFFVRMSNGVSKFFRDTKSEIKKIVWPTPQSVFKNTGVVLVTIILIGLFVFGLDTALTKLLGLIMNVAA
jgi:preprotein translocase subunit SecE